MGGCGLLTVVWLSGKVHATILKGIVVGFEFSFFSKKFERMAREFGICL